MSLWHADGSLWYCQKFRMHRCTPTIGKNSIEPFSEGQGPKISDQWIRMIMLQVYKLQFKGQSAEHSLFPEHCTIWTTWQLFIYLSQCTVHQLIIFHGAKIQGGPLSKQRLAHWMLKVNIMAYEQVGCPAHNQVVLYPKGQYCGAFHSKRSVLPIPGITLYLLQVLHGQHHPFYLCNPSDHLWTPSQLAIGELLPYDLVAVGYLGV